MNFYLMYYIHLIINYINHFLCIYFLDYLSFKVNEQQTRQYKAELEQASQQQQQADQGIAQARSHQLSLKEDFES